MRVRAVAAIALSGALALGLGGCTYFMEPATMDQYAPSDGAYVSAGELSIHNFLVISEDGELGNLVGGAANNTGADIPFTLQWNVGGTWHSIDLVAKANSLTQFGVEGGEIVHLSPAAKPGVVLEAAVVVGGETTSLHIPVLDTVLGEYADLAPIPAPEPEPTVEATPEPTETATP